MFFAPFPEEGIADYIAHGPIIRVLMVLGFGVRGEERGEGKQRV